MNTGSESTSEPEPSADRPGLTTPSGPGPGFSGPSFAVAELLGPALPVITAYGNLLSIHGVGRGLLGPREVPRLWERHLVNTAAVVPFLPVRGDIVDLGSGAGLPGIVVAAMLPKAKVTLIEPMERRCRWLNEVIVALSLTNVTVLRGRAEEFAGSVVADAVTSRAVAALDKLAQWSFPLLRVGGELVALKGTSVTAEIPAAAETLREYGAGDPEVLSAPTVSGMEPTTVVRVRRGR